jgi:hypothetical protein
VTALENIVLRNTMMSSFTVCTVHILELSTEGDEVHGARKHAWQMKITCNIFVGKC